MPPTVTVLTLHGIGTYVDENREPVEFDSELQDGVTALLPEDVRSRVRFQQAHWSNHRLLYDQRRLLRERKPTWPWQRFFRFAVESLSDATAFQLPAAADLNDWEAYRSSAYAAIQYAVRDALSEAEQKAGPGPVIIVAQSMGCHVVSQYAWDAEEEPTRLLREGEREENLSAFVRLRTLHSAVFTGCNIPLLTMTVPRDRKVPMVLAGRGPGSVWLNYYDPDDPLGYGIEKEYASYYGKKGADPFEGNMPKGRNPASEVQPSDELIEVRSLVGLTPFAHQRYWRQRTVRRAVAKAIEAALADATSGAGSEAGRRPRSGLGA